MYYPQEVIEEVRVQNDIVGVISSYMPLKQSGYSYMGKCPFHNDSSPSFSVSADRQLFHCFGCGAAGNVFGFVMQMENMDFPEALKFLADKARITLPNMTFSENVRKIAEEKAKIAEVNKKAGHFFYNNLQSDDAAKSYLEKRGIGKKIQRAFGIGYSSNSLLSYLKKDGYSDEFLEKAGLVVKKENGYRDKFYKRIMFPIIDVTGKVVGFGGRVTGDGQPKYLNSPDTLLFDKSNCLYGINFAKAFRSGIIVVEGYLDVIALYQAGFKNAVAALGTAFSGGHAKLLRKYTDNVTLLFDGDEAGQKAVKRALPYLTSAGFKPKVLVLPNAKDPDEFIKNYGADEFRVLLQNSQPYISYHIDSIRSKTNFDNTEDRLTFAQQATKVLATLNDSIEQDVYIKEVSSIANVSEESIKNEIKKAEKIVEVAMPKVKYSHDTAIEQTNSAGLIEAQRGILSAICNAETCARVEKHLSSDDFSDALYKKMAEAIFLLHKEGKQIHPGELTSRFETVEEQSEIARILINESVETNDVILLHQIKMIKEASCDKKLNVENDFETIQKLIQLKRTIKTLTKL